MLGPWRYERYVPELTRIALNRSDLGHTVPAGLPPRFAEAALYHGVAGQVLLAARGGGGLTLAGPVQRQLESTHAAAMVTSALLRSEAPRVRRVIAEATGVEPLLIKGPAVADRFYSDTEERPFVDLDFLLPAERVAVASRALVETLDYLQLELPWPDNLAKHAHSVQLHRSVGVNTLAIELHWRISDDPAAAALLYDPLAARAARWPGDPEVLVPDRARQLLLLAVHLVTHGYRRLSWLIDIRRISETAHQNEWLETFSLAGAMGLEWVLHAALDDVERVTGPLRQRPSGDRSPGRWGPLRVAQTLPGEAVVYHVGHLSILSRSQRLRYLLTGADGVLQRAIRAYLPKC